MISSMIQWVIDNFGQYVPLGDVNGPFEGLASIDWTYIFACLLFLTMLTYCLRIILAFFKGVTK